METIWNKAMVIYIQNSWYYIASWKPNMKGCHTFTRLIFFKTVLGNIFLEDLILVSKNVIVDIEFVWIVALKILTLRFTKTQWE